MLSKEVGQGVTFTATIRPDGSMYVIYKDPPYALQAQAH